MATVPDFMVDEARKQAAKVLRSTKSPADKAELVLGCALAFLAFAESAGLKPPDAARMMGLAAVALSERKSGPF